MASGGSSSTGGRDTELSPPLPEPGAPPPETDPKQRFSERVADYVRWRPGYPAGVVDVVAEVTGLAGAWAIADLGSGTGLSSVPFLERGHRVFAVEPNDEMRSAAEGLLGDHPGFTSVAGSAESTGLADASVDLIVAGQAFHWFDQAATREEARRILGVPGWALVMWNVRQAEADEFARGYEALLQRWGTDYARVRHRRITSGEMAAFFGAAPVEHRLYNEQVFDFEGLQGRHLSSSYVPARGNPDHEPMMHELRELFEAHARDGVVRFRYDTQLFISRLN